MGEVWFGHKKFRVRADFAVAENCGGGVRSVF